MTDLVVLHLGNLSDEDTSIFAIADFMGVDASYFCVTNSGLTSDQLSKKLLSAKAVAMSADTMCALVDGDLSSNALEELFGHSVTDVLIYGYRPEKRHIALVSRLTVGAVSKIDPERHGVNCSFPRAGAAYSRQLAGCDFERQPSEADCCFRLETSSDINILMEVAGGAAFFCTNNRNAQLFHWTAIDAIANPIEKIVEQDVPRRCDRFVPPIIFLRAVFKDSCWDNPMKTARVIIDDPLLERTYGFLRYDHVMQSLHRLRYGVTTAFIPWNYRRTTRKAASFFVKHAPAHSICIHGCDHTSNEFGITDEKTLQQKAVAAVTRLEKHRQRTGIVYDEVMVFPQGRFSSVAIRALRRANCLAVVNSTRMPTDASDSGLTLAQELLPASNCRSGLPIFMRRYPKHLSEYALDLFLGRPVYVVEHHNWFEHGCHELERCVQWLKDIEPNLSWPSLADGMRRQHLRRNGRDGECQIRFFTHEFVFENTDSCARLFLFSKPEPEPCLVEMVLVDGAVVPFAHEDEMITFKYEMRPLQKIMITLSDVGQGDISVWSPGLKYQAQVCLRRALSELRDNHLVKHPGLLLWTKKIVQGLKWTPKSGRGVSDGRGRWRQDCG